MIFVDTSAWYAFCVPTDPDHLAALDWLAQNRAVLVTSDYILDELLTLLKARGEYRRALLVGDSLLVGKAARLEWVVPSDVEAARRTYARFHDKAWSFTDCVSLAVMERLSVTEAFACDVHFEQFGSITVHPA